MLNAVMHFRLPGTSTLEMVLKYQLPGHSMEELIALRTNEDLDEFKVCIAFLSNANILTRLYFSCRLLIPLLRTKILQPDWSVCHNNSCLAACEITFLDAQ